MAAHTRREIVQNELRYNSPDEVLERMTASGWDRDKVIEILKDEADDWDGPGDGSPDGGSSPFSVLQEHRRVFVLAGVVVLGLLVGGMATQYSPSGLFGPSTGTDDGPDGPQDDTDEEVDGPAGSDTGEDDPSTYTPESPDLETSPDDAVFQRTGPVDVVASDRLLGYWPLDEYSGGSTPDMSGNGYHLRFWGSDEAPDGPSIAEGRHGSSIKLCKNCWGQTVSDPAGLNRSTVTISFWFQPGVTDNTEEDDLDILHAKIYDGEWPNYRIGGADPTVSPPEGWTGLYVRRYTENAAFVEESEQETFSASEWHHAAVQFDDKQVTIYIDGEEDWSSSYEATGALLNDIDEFQLGGSAFTGRVDDLRVYEGALTTDQLQTIMEGN